MFLGKLVLWKATLSEHGCFVTNVNNNISGTSRAWRADTGDLLKRLDGSVLKFLPGHLCSNGNAESVQTERNQKKKLCVCVLKKASGFILLILLRALYSAIAQPFTECFAVYFLFGIVFEAVGLGGRGEGSGVYNNFLCIFRYQVSEKNGAVCFNAQL